MNKSEQQKQEFCYIDLDDKVPLVAAAIHNGHFFSKNLEKISALTESERLREEDPFTGKWTKLSSNRIIANYSRFEVDLNRPRDKCIYLEPEDAWGLNLWHSKPSEEVLTEIISKYDNFYSQVRSALTRLLDQIDKIVIFDIHSYNHRRQGPDKPADDPLLNPEVNIGTGTMDREYWSVIVDRFIQDLQNYNFLRRKLNVRENIKFKGGYFSRWLHENFPRKVCCLSIEFKKFFMNEWTGEGDSEQIDEIYSALKSTVPGTLTELKKMNQSGTKK